MQFNKIHGSLVLLAAVAQLTVVQSRPSKGIGFGEGGGGGFLDINLGGLGIKGGGGGDGGGAPVIHYPSGTGYGTETRRKGILFGGGGGGGGGGAGSGSGGGFLSLGDFLHIGGYGGGGGDKGFRDIIGGGKGMGELSLRLGGGGSGGGYGFGGGRGGGGGGFGGGGIKRALPGDGGSSPISLENIFRGLDLSGVGSGGAVQQKGDSGGDESPLVKRQGVGLGGFLGGGGGGGALLGGLFGGGGNETDDGRIRFSDPRTTTETNYDIHYLERPRYTEKGEVQTPISSRFKVLKHKYKD